MVMIKDREGREAFYMDKKVVGLADRIKVKLLHEDSMVLGIVWGEVGSGKSLWSQKLGYVIDNGINIHRVCFNKEEFVDAVLEAKKGEVIIGDEGIAIFFSRGSMTKEGRLMAELMAQIRQKNLCVLVCVPELLSVDWLVLKAANFICYVWESKEMVHGQMKTMKGNIAMYPSISGQDFKMRMVHYLRTKKRNPQAKIMKPIPIFTAHGDFIGSKVFYPVGEEAYRKKKEAILEKYRHGSSGKKKERAAKIDYTMIDALLEKGIKHRIIADKMGVAYNTIRKRSSELNRA